jgi:2-keto-4-pentenoate hydratase/2-oxohepta-3-ene-1,7-dioic acid hydratase in catechol pathway
MKLVSFRGVGDEIRTGVVVDDRVLDLKDAIANLVIAPAHQTQLTMRGITVPESGMMRLLYAGEDGIAAIRHHAAKLEKEGALARSALLSATRLLAPIPRPGKIVAIGRNYADHAAETGVKPFEKPRIIAKLSSSVTGPGSTVRRAAGVVKLDLEAELAVVIGRFASNVSRAGALDVAAGYTALNDVSAREFQFDVSPPQTTFAKSMDGFCPMGPWLVTRDEIADPQRLAIRSFINDSQMQHGNTADMLFPIDRLIEYLSQFMTLEPGDVIATGTPAGIGAFRDPPVWLRPGDRVRIEVEGVGVLTHEIG